MNKNNRSSIDPERVLLLTTLAIGTLIYMPALIVAKYYTILQPMADAVFGLIYGIILAVNILLTLKNKRFAIGIVFTVFMFLLVVLVTLK